MLYMFGGSKITRVHGPFVSDGEVQEVVKSLKKQADPVYIETMFDENAESDDGYGSGEFGSDENKDELYNKAVEVVLRDKKVSISYIQRQLKIGYNRAANIVEEMEQQGLVSEAGPTGKREILVNS